MVTIIFLVLRGLARRDGMLVLERCVTVTLGNKAIDTRLIATCCRFYSSINTNYLPFWHCYYTLERLLAFVVLEREEANLAPKRIDFSDMYTTNRIANQVAKVVPFHCIICFEEFNLTDKAPVILPCGHTYLCEPCSKRIKTCMECRTPLFWTPTPRPATAPLTPSYRSSNNALRYRYQQQHAAPVSPIKAPEPVPLPIPKNVVLLAMLEAAERQTMMAGSIMDISQEDMEEDAITGVGEDEETEVKRIIAGMESLTGPCGTYAVRDEEGLAVLSQNPRRQNHEQVRYPTEYREPFTIEKGQTVQVVDIDNGVVKLARGMGYIVAGESQLVKVGGPLDRSCQLEGTLDIVEQRKLELQRELSQIERVSIHLKEQIDGVEEEDPTHPIITLPQPPSESKEDALVNCPVTPVQTMDRPFVTESPTVVTEGNDCVELTHSPLTPRRDRHSLPHNVGSPFSIDNADLSGHFNRLSTAEEGFLSIYQRMDDNDPPGIVDLGCSSMLFGRICASQDDEEDGMKRLIGLSFDSEGSDMIPPRPPTLSPSITADPSNASVTHRSVTSPQRTASFDTIDFRTGMSGHRGALSSRTSDPRATPRRNIRMMSSHMGIGRIRCTPPTKPKATGTT